MKHSRVPRPIILCDLIFAISVRRPVGRPGGRSRANSADSVGSRRKRNVSTSRVRELTSYRSGSSRSGASYVSQTRLDRRFSGSNPARESPQGVVFAAPPCPGTRPRRARLDIALMNATGNVRLPCAAHPAGPRSSPALSIGIGSRRNLRSQLPAQQDDRSSASGRRQSLENR